MPDFQIAGSPQNLVGRYVTIPSGGNVSEMLPVAGLGLLYLWTPTNGWTDAAIGFKTGWNGNANYLANAYNDGGTLEQCIVSTDAAATSIGIPFPSPDVMKVPFLQLTSVVAGSAAPTAQLAERVIYMLFGRYLS